MDYGSKSKNADYFRKLERPAFKQGEKLDAAKNSRGIPSSNSGILYLILSLFGFSIVAWALMQNELNKLA